MAEVLESDARERDLRRWLPGLTPPDGLTLDDLVHAARHVREWTESDDFSGAETALTVYRELAKLVEDRRARGRPAGAAC
jgi:hypothetical protein